MGFQIPNFEVVDATLKFEHVLFIWRVMADVRFGILVEFETVNHYISGRAVFCFHFIWWIGRWSNSAEFPTLPKPLKRTFMLFYLSAAFMFSACGCGRWEQNISFGRGQGGGADVNFFVWVFHICISCKQKLLQ